MSDNVNLSSIQPTLKERLALAGFKFELRDNQERSVRGLAKALKDGERPVLWGITGFGKSVVAAACFTLGKQRAVDQGTKFRGLILSHTRPLRKQLARSLRKAGLNAAAFTSKSPDEAWLDAEVISATRQTLDRPDMLDRLRSANTDLVIVDECHRAGAQSYNRVLKAILEGSPNARIIGMSATPARSDGEPIWPFTATVAGPSLKALIAEKSLVPPRIFEPQIDGAEHVRSGIQSMYDSPTLAGMENAQQVLDTVLYNTGIVEQWQDRARDRVTVGFCTTIDHSEHLAEAFKANGYRFAAYHSRLSEGERDEVIAKLNAGELQGVINPLSLNEGFDFPPVSCVLLCRPFMHVSTLTQAIGRGLRVVRNEDYPDFAEKIDCIVLDFAGAVGRHGRIDCPPAIQGTLYDTSGGASKADIFIQCGSCDAFYPSTETSCPECGAPKAGARNDNQDQFTVAPDLVELKGILEAKGFGSFRWYGLTPADNDGLPRTLAANAQDAAAVIARERGKANLWRAYVKSKQRGENWPTRPPCRLYRGTLQDCMERAGDYLDAHGCHKTGAIAGPSSQWQTRMAGAGAIRRLKMRRLTPHPKVTAEAASAVLHADSWRHGIEQDLGSTLYIHGRSVAVFDPHSSMESAA